MKFRAKMAFTYRITETGELISVPHGAVLDISREDMDEGGKWFDFFNEGRGRDDFLLEYIDDPYVLRLHLYETRPDYVKEVVVGNTPSAMAVVLPSTSSMLVWTTEDGEVLPSFEADWFGVKRTMYYVILGDEHTIDVYKRDRN